MSLNILLIFSAIFFVFCLISGRIKGTIITPPILFTGIGYLLSQTLVEMDIETFSEGSVHFLAEITLVLVLAADASRISLPSLYKNRAIPSRLLFIALPMIIALGIGAGLILLPGIGWVEAALIAAILAPTDAALGASVLADERVPARIRQSLNVESGLNDGISLPAVLFFACFLTLSHQTGEVNWLIFIALQLTLGPVAGVIIGWIGGSLIGAAASRNWITENFQGVAAMALAIVAFASAELIGGNGFIAAFVAGLIYGNLKVSYSHFLHEFTETESEFLAHLTFLLFGLVLLPEALEHITPPIIAYALVSLTLVRMIPVAISMIGMHLRLPTLAFMGWFGPRGLASLLFSLLILEDIGVEQADAIQAVVGITVLASILLHGMTAAPLSALYGRWATRHTTSRCSENIPVSGDVINTRGT